MTFQLTNGQVDRGPDSCDGQTLVGIVLDAAYTFQADHADASDVTAHEVSGGGYTRLAGDATSDLVTDTGIRTVYLEDVTTTTTDDDIGGIAWFLPGASDALRLYVGYSADPTPAGTYEPTYPDGLFTYTVDPGPSNLVDLDDVQGLPADGEVPTWDNAEGMFVFAASGAGGGDADAEPVACPPGEITNVTVVGGTITAHKYVFGQITEDGGNPPILALPPAADHLGQIITQATEQYGSSGPLVEVIPPDPDRKPALDFTAWFMALTTTDFGGGGTVDFDLDGATVTATFTGSMTAADILTALLTPLVTAGATYSGLVISSPTDGGSISITDPGTELDFSTVQEYGLGGYVRTIDNAGGGFDADAYYGPGTANTDYELVGVGYGTHSVPTGASDTQRTAQVVAIADPGVFSGARWTAVGWPIRSEYVPFSLGFGNVHEALDALLNFQSDTAGTYGYEVTLTDVDGEMRPSIALVAPGSGSVATDAIFDAKGDLPVGTGANTAAKLTVGTNGQVLVADSGEPTGVGWATVSGTGDVVGPASAVDSHVALFDTTTGKLLKDGGALGDAAAKNTGTTAGTLAAGDDSRITGAAQKSSNLSDLASASTARTNLGLGSLAVANYVPGAVRVIAASRTTGSTVIATPIVPVVNGGTTLAIALGDQLFCRVNHSGQTLTTLGVLVSATSLTGSQTIEISCYNDLGDWTPGTRAWTRSLTIGTSTGWISASSLSLAMPTGGCWISVLNPSGNAGTVTLRTGTPTMSPAHTGMANGTFSPVWKLTSVASATSDASAYTIRSTSTGSGVYGVDAAATFPILGALA